MASSFTEIAAEIKRQIDEKSGEVVEPPRWHLGASQIGDECLRRVWNQYRWILNEQFSGRMRRLFERGHKEEPGIAGLLQSIGFTVQQHDPNTGEQYLASLLYGHYGGSGDGFASHDGEFAHLGTLQLECKTHNRKSFNDLVKHGVIKSKPKHYIQMCVYGGFFGCTHGLYVAVCKDDDDLHIEIVELDRDVAERSTRKAEKIINAQTPPDRISANPSYYICKQCHYRSVCHHNAEIDRNCRSCVFAVPSSGGNAQWRCNRWNIEIPKGENAAETGCGEWSSII